MLSASLPRLLPACGGSRPHARRTCSPAYATAAPGVPEREHTGEAAPKQQQRRKPQGPRRGGAGGRGGGGGRPAGGRGRGGASPPSTWCEVETAPAWRLFGVKVPADQDPGKDEYGVHPLLLAAISKKVSTRSGEDWEPLPAEAVRVVRKSFDARSTKGGDAASGKAWAYLVDVESGALAAAGVKRLQDKPGLQERQQQLQEPPVLLDAAIEGGGSSSGSSSSSGKQETVVVVGGGPAGLFAALELAEAGIKVVLLERGQPVEVRGKDIGALFVRRQVNPESNLCYGEGGAGTWSDGKLTTRIGRNSDPVRQVLNTLYCFGAPESVLVSGKPHLGTDRLVRILKAFRQHLISLGCEVRFGTRVEDVVLQGGRLTGVKLTDGSAVPASRVVLAPGHSSRDLYRSLVHHDISITPKPFAMGFRIEHPQELINQLQYGADDAEQVQRGKGRYPVAEYRLAAEISAADAAQAAAAAAGAAPDGSAFTDDWYQPLLATAGGEEGARGVYSFCMCPGGQIVPTSTNEEELCINGMSFSRRDSKWANSALVVAVQPGDWAHLEAQHGALAGMALQQEYERDAAQRGGGAFVVPAQRASDFLAGQTSSGMLPTSSYRLGIKAAPLHDFYPPHMTAAFVAALTRFERQMPGFASDQALLHAAETRTSAPLRIDRAPDSLQSTTLPGLYPCGEGAGYAGGIVSSAVDGLRVGATIVAELTGQEGGLPDAAAFKVKAGY